jgi:hypothetical protein
VFKVGTLHGFDSFFLKMPVWKGCTGFNKKKWREKWREHEIILFPRQGPIFRTVSPPPNQKKISGKSEFSPEKKFRKIGPSTF